MDNSLPKIEAITLDAAGTLFHLAEPVGTVYSRTASTYGINVTPDAVERSFRSVWKHSPLPHRDGPEDERAWWRRTAFDTLKKAGAVDLSEDTFEPLFVELFTWYAHGSAWQLYPDTLPFLKAAAPSARLAVISNFDDRLISILSDLGIASFFEVIYTSARAKSSKPDPAIFDLTATELKIEPAKILHIGDEPIADWEGARNAGYQAYELKRPHQGLAEVMFS